MYNVEKDMKTKLYISILFCFVAVNTWAQTFKNTYTPSETPQEYQALKSQPIKATGAHDGTIYEPFSNTVPSEQGAPSQTEDKTSIRDKHVRTFIGGPESGQGPTPLGDSLLPLMLMAMLFAGVIAVRKKRTLKG